MSYCRFRNTLDALFECMEALEGMSAPMHELSGAELSAAKGLVRLSRIFVRDYAADLGEEGGHRND